ncbi:hypothetical protein COY07_06370 [Candidatus Peregrinibacteria bacterium CG_4_10_14_0_2_um_filter_43_11]|nr:MAG: hypothetical protein COY07_06370 [Candidatus Peregrinibacteria bacterium CG_4_10_14_0_2_um_filter_43_11]
MTLKQKGFITVSLAIVGLLSLPFVADVWINATAAKHMYETVENVQKKELVLVLGAAAYNANNLSTILEDRMQTAVDLYKNKKAEKIRMSGDKQEVIAMTNYAKKQGIPEDALLKDEKGFNTLASILNMPKEPHDILIVTQRFHLPRALFYANHFGFNADGVVADRHEYIKIYEFKKRELLANTKAFFDVFITPDFNEWVREF